MSDLIADRGNPNYSDDGIQLKGEPGIKGRRRERRMMQLANSVFMRRERGMSVDEIAKEVHTVPDTVRRILHDTKLVKRRLDMYNEQLRSATPLALKVVFEVLQSTDPKQMGERAKMATWVLEATKTVGKDSPVNVFIKGGDTVVNVSNDTLEAAKAVSQAMMAAAKVRALPQSSPKPPQQGGGAVGFIDAEAVDIPTEENSPNEQPRDNVGITNQASDASVEQRDTEHIERTGTGQDGSRD